MPMNPRLLRPLARRQAPPTGTPAKLLLHFDGSLVDSSPSPLTVTAVGDAQVTTAQYKFGSGSAVFDGDGDVLTAVTGEFAGDYTIEFWFRVSNSEAFWSLIGYKNGIANMHVHTFTDGLLYANDAQTGMISGGTVVADTWSHIALVRAGTTTTLYQDGAEVGSTTSSIGQGDGTLAIGFINGGNYLMGHIDELRVVEKAVYLAPFSPPTAQLSAYVP